jgi:hypothetical protein
VEARRCSGRTGRVAVRVVVVVAGAEEHVDARGHRLVQRVDEVVLGRHLRRVPVVIPKLLLATMVSPPAARAVRKS